MPHPEHAQAIVALDRAEDLGVAWDVAMRRGDFERAWAVSDAVLARADPAKRDDPAVPYHHRWVWDGRPIDGQRVLVRCYHGLGDTLQFCRYLHPLRQRAGQVTLEVQASLAGLLAWTADHVVPFDPAAPLPRADCEIEIMELPHALRLRPEPAPYLPIARRGGGGVGFCWAAGGWDSDRDIPADALRPLVERVRGVSLQRGPAQQAAAGLGLPDPLDGAMGFRGLAHLVAGLDAVVTVDTMAAHLAGAIGVPALVLLKSTADWRWGNGERCLWYEGAQLFRQPAAGDWAAAVRELSLSATFQSCCTRDKGGVAWRD